MFAAAPTKRASEVGGASRTPKITLASLLEEMLDRDTLARWPDPPYTCKQTSSWDRGAITPDQPVGQADGSVIVRPKTLIRARAMGGHDRATAEKLTIQVIELLEEQLPPDHTPTVEEVQDALARIARLERA